MAFRPGETDQAETGKGGIMIDAAGNIPRVKNNFERQWAESVENGEVQKRFDALKERQKLPLKDKIRESEERIIEWHNAFDGNVGISFSGGVDSTVLTWLARRLYPNIEAVFCNTGLEYPELYQFVKNTPNVHIIKPKMPFGQVLKTYGYPLISKKVARGLSILRNPTSKNQNIYRLYSQGINRFGEPVNGFQVPERWKQTFLKAPFELSDKCCEVMKKEPMRRYTRETGNVQFIGTMASDSKQRQRSWLQHGCNAYDLKNPHSTPLSFWTKQDVLQCLKMFNIPYANVYGDIKQNRETGKLYFTGVQSTGCVFCGFGLHMETQPNRFQRLYYSHPKLWKYCMDTLGLRKIMQYIQDNCPDKCIRNKFKIEPDPEPYKQMSIFKERSQA